MNYRHLIETQLTSNAVFDGALLHVRQDSVRLSNGQTAQREHIIHPGAVVIIPLLPDGRFLIERQFRYPLQQVMIEFPAGKIDPNEDKLTCAKRELLEETGYHTTHWQYLGMMHPAIAYSNEMIHIYLARNLIAGKAQPDHGELLEVSTMHLEQMKAAVFAGEITDAKTITCLYWAEYFLHA